MPAGNHNIAVATTWRNLLLVLALLASQGLYAQLADTRQDDARGESQRGEYRGIGGGVASLFTANCAVCHAENLTGAAQGTPLVGVDLMHGDSVGGISQSISNGFPDKGMPAWSAVLTGEQIKSLALYVAESRSGFTYTDFNIASELVLPEGIQHSEEHDFRLELVVEGLDPLPFSIAPLPDGRILLTEKMRGLSIVSRDGRKSDFITGTPATYDDARVTGIQLSYGLGWLLDVAIHPRYEENGWIYLHYTDRCSDCNAMSRQTDRPVSMNTLIRGRILDGAWVDEEIIWKADVEAYTAVTDLAAGGRIAFDPEGFVFISIGMKGPGAYTGIQNLATPYGKILRLHDDGRIPLDNPFVDTAGAAKTIWTYGHRSPQGLEFDVRNRQLWGTEHGPRGGDEVNLLLPGKNYGWPLYSKGMNYNGTTVDHGKRLGIEFELKDIQQPIVDLTPSPAVSSFVFYEGNAFPQWRHNLIVGTLKATELYRMVIEGNKLVHRETLIQNLARIRDLEVGPNGAIYLLLEHAAGGQIVRLTPTKEVAASP